MAYMAVGYFYLPATWPRFLNILSWCIASQDKKHYHAYITPASETPSTETPDTTHICGVILRYGKNKGKMCTNSTTCRVHVNKNKIV